MNILNQLVEEKKILNKGSHYEFIFSKGEFYRVEVHKEGNDLLLVAYRDESYLGGYYYEEEISLKDLLDLYPKLGKYSKEILYNLIRVSNMYNKVA